MKNDLLSVVMPVYNEEEIIGSVLEKWHAALTDLVIDFILRPYNDGSKDGSLAVMQEAAHRLGPRIQVRDKPNGGHGNTILTGYREASEDAFDWIFQIDSDDEIGSEQFGYFWAHRTNADFLVGIRKSGHRALVRKLLSGLSRLCVRTFYGRGVRDVNCPFRLMRVAAFKDFYSQIPLNTFAPNVILSGLAARHKLRCFEAPVPHQDLKTGECSIRNWKLLKAALKSFWQTVAFAMERA